MIITKKLVEDIKEIFIKYAGIDPYYEGFVMSDEKIKRLFKEKGYEIEQTSLEKVRDYVRNKVGYPATMEVDAQSFNQTILLYEDAIRELENKQK